MSETHPHQTRMDLVLMSDEELMGWEAVVRRQWRGAQERRETEVAARFLHELELVHAEQDARGDDASLPF